MALTPKRRILMLVVPALLASALAVGVVRAQTPPPPPGAAAAPPAPPQGAPPPGPEGMGRDGGHDGGMHGRWGAMPALRVADRLATMQVYLGITPEQMGQWRAFTQAAIAMAPDPADWHAGMRDGAFEGIDRMSARMQKMAAAAQELDRAAQALKAVLTPEQITRADAAWRTMHAHHGWHHGMDDRRRD